MNQVFLYVTAGTAEEAIQIGRAVVDARLAACANVIPGMTSIYRWQDQIKEEPEVVLILKTRSDLVDDTVALIKSLHSYTCPCVVSIPLEGGNGEFLQWIKTETS